MPAGLSLAQETKIRFMDKGGWLESVTGTLTSQVVGGQMPQFFVHAGHKIDQRFGIDVRRFRQSRRQGIFVAVTRLKIPVRHDRRECILVARTRLPTSSQDVESESF